LPQVNRSLRGLRQFSVKGRIAKPVKTAVVGTRRLPALNDLSLDVPAPVPRQNADYYLSRPAGRRLRVESAQGGAAIAKV
jgi:hypothetical protein